MPQLDRLGLRENPFKNNTEQRYFYEDPNRAQILESTEHLIEYSSNFQVIIGEPGVGKSHFLETLASHVDNNWRVAKVDNAEQYDTLSLIQAILDAFGAINSNHSELLEVLETQLAEINQLGFKPVLLVDSAQALSIDSLRFLIQLSQQKQNEEPYINIVLFATDEVSELLQSPELKSFRDIIHIATLNRFDKEGVSGFLRHKMAVAGFDRESPFTPRIIESIFNNSKGLPEKINFFANKFLVSSGKADNYIDPVSNSEATNELDEHFDESIDESFSTSSSNMENNDHFIDSLEDGELNEHRSDRAAEQLNRLAEKFEEIEQLGEQPVDSFFSDSESVKDESLMYDEQEQKNRSLTDGDEPETNFLDDESLTGYNEASESALPKFIIPIAVIGILLVAVFVINSVFEQSEIDDSQVSSKKTIALLPLELPPQDNVVQNQTADNIKESIPEQITTLKPNTSTALQTNPVEESDTPTEPVSTLEVIEATGSSTDSSTSEEKVLVNDQPEEKKSSKIEEKNIVIPTAIAKLIRVEPEPVIGSNSRQYITVIGKDFSNDISFIVSWADNKKEFSAQKTPKQWQYVDKQKIKLHLSTGITSQQWQVSAKSTNGNLSQSINFDVVKPFISKMVIDKILPKPFVGSDKRQTVNIMGQGFSKQTVLELKWDKNKKHFSSRLTPSQFEFVSAKHIKLFIATGTKERKWRVLATNPTGNSSTSSFTVIKESVKKNVTPIYSNQNTVNALKDESWLMQQPDTNYTIQLFGSHNKQAIDELVKKHSLTGDVLRFETQKEGKSWFTLSFGNYGSKSAANTAITSLAPELKKTTPWVRSMGSIKESLTSETKQISKTGVDKNVSSSGTTVLSTNDVSVNTRTNNDSSKALSPKVKDEAWIWTQNPADYTVQLIALSSKQGVENYIKKFQIQSEAVYFKTIRNNTLLYVLLYGHFNDKESAVKAGERLSSKIKGSKPWVRSFSTIHEMMSSR
ncbi:MAG: SPOR domain-containing protein [Gammaproteobacteria bacterium]|nr:SPOR domain-containing protein [Gammaproteobacteria bacterium]